MKNFEDSSVKTTEEEFGFPCIAKIVAVDREKYVCDCKELDNDGKEMRNTFMDVAIPKLVGSKDGGIFLTPTKGTIVLLNFLNGDRNYPIISAIMGGEHTPNSQENKLVVGANGKDLGEILIKMCEKIVSLQTVGSPSTQTLRQDQQLEWKNFVEQEIKGLFYQGNSGYVGGSGDTGTDSKPEPDTDTEILKPLFKSGKYRKVDSTSNQLELIPIEELILQMDSVSYTKLEKMADEVRLDMKDSFETIAITSVNRTVKEQVNILSNKMRRLSGTLDMYMYYRKQITEKYIGKSDTLNYLNGIQSYFDGTEEETIENIRWKLIKEKHREEIMAMGKISNKDKKLIKAEELLTKYMTLNTEDFSFLPSSHMNHSGKVTVVDISIRDDRRMTAEKLLKRNRKEYPSCSNKPITKKCEGGYISVTEGDPHIHLKIKN